MTILLSLESMEIYHQLAPLEIITLMEINNSDQLMIKSSYWRIVHTFRRHFGRTTTPSASCLMFLDCCQKESFCLFFCQTNWIKKSKCNSRASATSLWSSRTDTVLWSFAHLLHILFASMALPVQTTYVGLDPLHYLSRKGETTQEFLKVSALDHLLAASWEEVTLLKHCRFSNLHQNNQLEKKKCFQVANPVLAPQRKD